MCFKFYSITASNKFPCKFSKKLVLNFSVPKGEKVVHYLATHQFVGMHGMAAHAPP